MMTLDEAREILSEHYPNTISGDVILREYGFALVDGDKLHFIFVKPSHRGEGLGADLVKAARKYAGRPLRLNCVPGLVAYYEALGFETQFTADGGEHHYMRQVD